MFETLSTRTAFENRFVTLREEAVRLPDGSESVYAYIARPRYAIAAAVEDGEIWMVEQWRHPLRRRTWELPMGVAPGGDAIPVEEAARIELREETGVTALNWRYVAEVAPAPALVAQTGALFLATGLTLGPQQLEDTEQDLVARPWPVERAVAAAVAGEIIDAVSSACLMRLRLMGEI